MYTELSRAQLIPTKWLTKGRQNYLRHFARKGLFDVLPIFKGKNEPFPLPFPPCNDVPLFEPRVENNKHLNFEWRGRGGVWILCSLKLRYLSTISQQVCRRLKFCSMFHLL